MKHFIRHSLYFLIAFCLTQLACNNLLLKNRGIPYYHNKQFTTKYHHYLSKERQFNTVFIGSSRTYRQISPEIIDHELAELNIRSYNMGCHASFIPETFYHFELFLENQPVDKPVRYVFMELTGINNIKFTNWFVPQSYYYIDMDMLRLVWGTHFQNPDLNGIMAWMYTYPYIQGYVLKNIIPQFQFEARFEPETYTGEKGDGYYPLDLDLAQNQTDKLISRRTSFLKDTTVLLSRRDKQLRRKKEDIKGPYVDYLNHLVSVAGQKNIKLYYIIPPKLKYYRSLAGLNEAINDQRVIDMGGYEEYPHLNFAEFNFDGGHFNSDGAELYSTYLAQKIKERLMMQQNPGSGEKR